MKKIFNMDLEAWFYVITMIITVSASIMGKARISEFLGIDTMYVTGFIYCVYAICFLYCGYLVHKKYFRDFLKNKCYTKYVKYGFLCSMVSNILIKFMLQLEPNSTNNARIEADFMAEPVKTFIVAVILAPIVEELLFREGIHKFIKNEKLFIIIGSCLFAIPHITYVEENWHNYLHFFIYFSMGVIMSYIYVKTSNLLTSISLHFCINLWGMTLMILIMKLQEKLAELQEVGNIL